MCTGEEWNTSHQTRNVPGSMPATKASLIVKQTHKKHNLNATVKHEKQKKRTPFKVCKELILQLPGRRAWVLTRPTWLGRLLVSNMDDGAAEATLRRNWGYTFCLCGHGQRRQRRWFTYEVNWTTWRDNTVRNLVAQTQHQPGLLSST